MSEGQQEAQAGDAVSGTTPVQEPQTDYIPNPVHASAEATAIQKARFVIRFVKLLRISSPVFIVVIAVLSSYLAVRFTIFTEVVKLSAEVGGLQARVQEMGPFCPGGYTKKRGVCFKVFEKAKNFNGAATTCRKDGGTLAMPRDAEINAFLVDLYTNVDDYGFWIGLRKQHGRFEWVDGSALGTSFTPWAPGEPDGGGCVSYAKAKGRKGKWEVLNCDMYSIQFICQVTPTRTR
ncbi:perlucin-like protein isoform X5 [Branchiostoma floridae x Branchiostoma belcheri]